MILIGTFFILNLILAVIFDTYVEKRDKRNRLLRLKFHQEEIILTDEEFIKSHLSSFETVSPPHKGSTDVKTIRHHRVSLPKTPPPLTKHSKSGIPIDKNQISPSDRSPHKSFTNYPQSSNLIDSSNQFMNGLFGQQKNEKEFHPNLNEESLQRESESERVNKKKKKHKKKSKKEKKEQKEKKDQNEQTEKKESNDNKGKRLLKKKTRLIMGVEMEIKSNESKQDEEELNTYLDKDQMMIQEYHRQVQEEKDQKEFQDLQRDARADTNKIYKCSLFIVRSFYFDLLISLSVIANTTLQCLDQYPTPWYFDHLDKINSFFSLIFILELLIKILALGFNDYKNDPFNVFDCIVVITSFIDVILTNVSESMNLSQIIVLRIIRLLRLFKLAKIWRGFQFLLITILKSIVSISKFTIILFLFIFVYSILGMETFANKAKFDDGKDIDNENGTSIERNFDNFLWSFTTVFVLLTEDGWMDIYEQYYRAVSGVKATFYFLSLYILGTKIILNLFIAILMNNFDEDSKRLENEKQFEEEVIIDKKNLSKWELYLVDIFERIQDLFNPPKPLEEQKDDAGTLKEDMLAANNLLALLGDQGMKEAMDVSSSIQKTMSAKLLKQHEMKQAEQAELRPQEVKTLWIFSHENPIRKVCFSIVHDKHQRFEKFILIFILICSIQLALTHPLNDPNAQLTNTLYWIDFITTIVFIVEFIIKIIAEGFLFVKGAYLTKTFNIMDFLILALSIVAVTPIANRLKVFKMFRVFSALRLISQAQGLRIGLLAMVKAIPNVLRIVLIMFVFFLIFGVLAITMFKGTFYYCLYDEVQITIPDYDSLFDVQTKWDCLNIGGDWLKNYFTFDNMYQSIASLFVISNIASWSDFMYYGAQATQIDYVWVQWAHPYRVIFFIIFMVVGSFFFLNVFVGIVISSFNRQKEQLGGLSLLSEQQKEYIEIQIMVLESRPIRSPKIPENYIGFICNRITQSPCFDYFIQLCIFVNFVILAIWWQSLSKDQVFKLQLATYCFTAFFLLEAIMKIIGTGRLYFFDKWNIFDLIILLLTITTILCENLTHFSLGSATMALRAIRLFKLVKYRKSLTSFRRVFKTFIACLKPLANIGSLLLLILYVYAIAGVSIFGQVMQNDILDETLNFESFYNSALSLFVVATTDGWTDLLKACLRKRAINFNCIENPSYQDYIDNNYQTVGCGPGLEGILYFYSYFLIIDLVLLKLFIAVICEAYEDIKKVDKRLFNDEVLERFNAEWGYIDPDATGYIPINALRFILKKLGEPLGFHDNHYQGSGRRGEDDILTSLLLPTYLNETTNLYYYKYNEVLDALAQKVTIFDFVQREKLEKEEAKIELNKEFNKKQEEEKLKKEEKHRKLLDPISEIECRAARFKLIKQLNMLIENKRADEILVLRELQQLIKEKELEEQEEKERIQYEIEKGLKSKEELLDETYMLNPQFNSKLHVIMDRAVYRMKQFVKKRRQINDALEVLQNANELQILKDWEVEKSKGYSYDQFQKSDHKGHRKSHDNSTQQNKKPKSKKKNQVQPFTPTNEATIDPQQKSLINLQPVSQPSQSRNEDGSLNQKGDSMSPPRQQLSHDYSKSEAPANNQFNDQQSFDSRKQQEQVQRDVNSRAIMDRQPHGDRNVPLSLSQEVPNSRAQVVLPPLPEANQPEMIKERLLIFKKREARPLVKKAKANSSIEGQQ